MLESGLERWVISAKRSLSAGQCCWPNIRLVKRQFVTLTVDDPKDGEPFGEAIYLSTVNVDGKAAGLVVSAGYGHRIGKSIAMAVLDKARSPLVLGSALHLDVTLGASRRWWVLYDPDNARMKV